MKSKIGFNISQLLLLLFISGFHCFNLDVNNYISHGGPDASMFGFSVALHQESQRSWVIIGAPKADTSNFQQGVRNGGAVYRCDISDDDRCQVIQFDTDGNNKNEKGEQIDTKSNQWFGATVSSAGIDGPLVACAPRYVYHQHNPRKIERNEPVGTCFIAKDNFREYQEYSPCRTSYWGYHRQGSCQAGLSAAVSKDGGRLFIGAPGSWYWQGQEFAFSLSNMKDKVYSTNESSSMEDDSYLGYSSVTGDFLGDGQQGVAVGMPRGGGLLGKVLLFTRNLTNHVNITGEQIGAYFGYSLCSVDVNGDKLDDLIIGAPMYTEPNNEGKYEHGLVYIAYQSRTENFKFVETREGVKSKGRFGLALTSLGDINLDGYGDFAVGAPYDGPNGRGAVYVFHGSRNGPLKKHSQVIFAEDVDGVAQLTTFGFSLAGGIDLDGNQYPDMVVGAYDSNRAIVFKSRAVAVMEASTSFEADNKLISLDNKNCTIGRDRKSVTCTIVSSCLKYNGINLPTSIDIEISWVLDSKKPKSPRMFFINDESKNIRNSTMRLYRGKAECRNESVFIADGIRDKLTPLEVEMKYNIRQATTSYTTSTVSRRRRATLEPVLDENRGTVQRDSINIMKNCGKDNICIPDLRLDVKTDDTYLLGSNESLTVEVLITNNGEDAFEASFFMNIPQGLNYKSTKRIGESRDTSYICTAPSFATNNTLKCDIGNPLPGRKSVNFKVYLEPSKRGGKATIAPFYDFYMEANSTNEEAEGGRSDNSLKKSVAIFVESDLSISGSSMPPELHYNVSQYKEFSNATHEAEIGPHVVHIYDIRNNGTSTIEEIEIFINWPAETLDGEPLMYLMNQPETLGPIKCDQTQFVNQAGLERDRVLERKSYLDKNRAPIRQGEFASSNSRFNMQGGSTFDGRNSFERESSQESTGDASFDHKNRGGSGHYESWSAKRGSSHGVTSGNAQGQGQRQGQGSHNFNWKATQDGGSASRDYAVNRGRGSSVDRRFEATGSQSGNAGSGYDYRSTHTSDGSSANVGGGSGYDYRSTSGGAASNANVGGGSGYDYRSTSGGSASNANVGGGSGYDYRSTSGGSASNANVGGGSGYDYRSTSGGSASNANVGGGSGYDYRSTSGGSVSNANVGGGSVYEHRGSSGSSGSSAGEGSAGYDYRGSSGSSSLGGGAGSNVREYEYRETWNSSSVNGGPAVTHIASQNRTLTRGQDGRVLVSETSTERVITGAFVGRWDDRESGSSNRRHEESSSSASQSQIEYERQQREYYETQRRHQEEERRRQIEDRRRQQEEQRRIELERRAEEERRIEEERRRSHEATYNSRSSSHDSGGSGYDYRIESSYGGGSSGGSRTASSSSSAGGLAGGRVESNFESSVDQDISKLAARTHAEQSSSGLSGYESLGGSGIRRMKSQQDGEGPRSGLITGVTQMEKVAQGGHGLQTVGVDLGVLGSRNNVDDEIRRQSSASGGIADGSRSASTSSHHSSGGRQSGISGHTYSSQIGGAGYQQYSNSDEIHGADEYEEYDENEDSQDQHNQQQGGQGSSWSRSSSYSYSNKRPLNAHHDTVDQQFKHYPSKRDVSKSEPLCKSTTCVNVRCVVGPLDKNTEALVALRTRLVAHTLNKLGGETEVKLSTMAIGRITKLPYIGEPANDTLKTHEVFVTAIPDPIPKPDVVPLWIVVLAACAGALILLLLIYLLYKCGFFKRNRPAGSPHERQPLNRNGNYHGDEHL